MSELAIMQQSRFNEILKEELEAIKKQLTEAQINLLCGPRGSVKAALSEFDGTHLSADMGPNATSIESTQPRQQSDAEEVGFRASPILKVRNAETLDLMVNGGQTSANAVWVVFDILINSDVGFSNGEWPRMSATDKMDFMFKMAQRMNLADDTDTGWQDLSGMNRGMVLVELNNVKIHDNISVAEWLHPFDVNRTLIDTRHLVDSNAYQAAKYFALVIGGGATIFLAGPGVIATVGTGLLYGGVAAAAFQGITYLLDGDTEEGIKVLFFAILEAYGFRLAKGSLAFFKEVTFVETMKRLGTWRGFKLAFYNTIVTALGIGSLATLAESGQAELPLKWNFHENEYGDQVQDKYWFQRPSRMQQDEEGDQQDEEGDDQADTFIASNIANGNIGVDEQGFQVQSGDGRTNAEINQFLSRYEGLTLAAISGVPSMSDIESVLETVIKNTNEILTESRFQKLAGI
jgi:hypothetical protein